MEYCDPNRKGYITFLDLRKILQNLSYIRLSERYVEFLIYLMKKNESDCSLEDLHYNNILKLLSEKFDTTSNITDDFSSIEEKELSSNINAFSNTNTNLMNNPLAIKDKNDSVDAMNTLTNNIASSKNEIEGSNLIANNPMDNLQENEDDEVVITIDQFNQKVDKILSKIAEHLYNSKKTVREYFAQFITVHNVTKTEHYEAIALKDFIQLVQAMKIILDTIDIYCIFTKLKYNDDFETIDVAKLKEEMINYGFFEENTSPEREKEKNLNTANSNNSPDDFLTLLSNKIKKENKSIDDFLFPVVGKFTLVSTGNNIKKLIKADDFKEFMIENKIMAYGEHFDERTKTLILEDHEEDKYVNINNLRMVIELNGKNAEDKKKNELKDENDEYELDFDQIQDGEVEGLD